LGACAQTRVRRRIFSVFPWWWGLKSWDHHKKYILLFGSH
jgi:hypothetical protein